MYPYLFFEDRDGIFHISVVPQTVGPFLEILDKQGKSFVLFHERGKVGRSVTELKIRVGLTCQIDDLLG